MNDDVPAVAVLASFDDRTAAEIASALLADASIHSSPPEAAPRGAWSIELRDIAPAIAARAEVILRSAGARDTRLAIESRQRAA